MKVTIDDLDKQAADYAAQIKQLAADAKDYAAKADKLDTEAEAAAAAGDLAGYKKKHNAAEDARAAAHVAEKQGEAMRNATPVTKEEAASAWEEYTKEYNKLIQQRISKYQEIKQQLREAYKSAVDLQQEACATRERLAQHCGIEDQLIRKSFAMVTIPCRSGADNTGNLILAGTTNRDPDLCFYLSAHMIEAKLSTADTAKMTADKIFNQTSAVVSHHKSS